MISLSYGYDITRHTRRPLPSEHWHLARCPCRSVILQTALACLAISTKGCCHISYMINTQHLPFFKGQIIF